MQELTLRTFGEILNAADLAFKYHRAVRSAEVKCEPLPSPLDAIIVYERRYTLEWLVNNTDNDWNNIRIHT